jgi:hypothetical protein
MILGTLAGSNTIYLSQAFAFVFAWCIACLLVGTIFYQTLFFTSDRWRNQWQTVKVG